MSPARLGALFRRHPTLWPLLALLGLLAWNLLFTPHFGELEVRDGRVYGSLVDVARRAVPILLMAIGMTMVIAVGGIDLSVGSLLALSGTIATMTLVHWGGSIWLAVAAGLGAAVLGGMVNGLMVTRAGLQPIVATLVLLVSGRGLAQVITGDQKVDFSAAPSGAGEAIARFDFLANGSLLGLPVPLYLAAAVAATSLLLTRKTALGLYVEAVGVNARAARLAGLPVQTVRMFAYAFSGLCAGLAGLIVTADIHLADVSNAGQYAELDAILAAVIGGTALTGGKARLVGSILGALLLQTLTIMLQMHHVPNEHTLLVKALGALAVCFLQTPAFAALAGRLAGKGPPA